MGDTSIEWTDTTWNPVVGCTKVSPGCQHCYAMIMAARIANAAQAALRAGKTLTEIQAAYRQVVRWERGGKDPADEHDKALPQWNNRVATIHSKLTEPLNWKKPRRVFVNSMSDLFHEGVPFEFIDQVFAVMALTPQHTYQILTKRPERMAEYLLTRDCSFDRLIKAVKGLVSLRGDHVEQNMRLMRFRDMGNKNPMPNVWLGTSVEDQAAADERIPHLLRCPAVVRFLSVEPLLGPVDATKVRVAPTVRCDVLSARSHSELIGDTHQADPGSGINWVIVGGESGPGARPCNIEWIRSIVGQCKAAGVRCFVKQLGPIVIEHDAVLNDEACGNWNWIKRHDPGLGVSQWRLKDSKGGDWSEWPEDLRVREFPALPGAGVNSCG